MKAAAWTLAAALVLLAAPLFAAKASKATSKGSPNAGTLVAGTAWTDTRYVRGLPGHAGRWGMPDLVAMVRQSAERVGRKHKGSILMIGDLSAKDGGPLHGHQSHQSGRDVDVGFYVTDAAGKPVRGGKFVRFGGDGRAKDGSELRFDDARNWELVASMLVSSRATVRMIFVSGPLKIRLMKEAAARGASKELSEKLMTTLMQPGNSTAHDDHFHVRVACAPRQKDVCYDDSRPGAPKKTHASPTDDTSDD